MVIRFRSVRSVFVRRLLLAPLVTFGSAVVSAILDRPEPTVAGLCGCVYFAAIAMQQRCPACGVHVYHGLQFGLRRRCRACNLDLGISGSG